MTPNGLSPFLQSMTHLMTCLTLPLFIVSHLTVMLFGIDEEHLRITTVFLMVYATVVFVFTTLFRHIFFLVVLKFACTTMVNAPLVVIIATVIKLLIASTLCFNCDRLGHRVHDCVYPMYCCICKSGTHLAYICPFSWHRMRVTTQEAKKLALRKLAMKSKIFPLARCLITLPSLNKINLPGLNLVHVNLMVLRVMWIVLPKPISPLRSTAKQAARPPMTAHPMSLPLILLPFPHILRVRLCRRLPPLATPLFLIILLRRVLGPCDRSVAIGQFFDCLFSTCLN